jgi:hypothetical protein
MIFPPRLNATLRDLRDNEWAQLIDQIESLDPTHKKKLAFELLIARWTGCFNCQTDSFRAMQGCAQCASQAVRRYRGSRVELQSLFSEATREVEAFLKNRDQ